MSNQNAVAVPTERRSLVESIKHPSFQAQISASLPPGVSLERFTAVTIAAVTHNPDLMNADRQSLYNSIVKAAQDGLLPDGNDAVLNIYNTKISTNPDKWVRKVQYQKMVGGILKLFEKAGIDAWADSIYENDLFDVWSDEQGQHYTHRPVRLGREKGPRIGAYAVAKRPGARSLIIQVMDMEDLEKVRNASKSPDKGPWKVWTDRMEQKSALHRLKKRVASVDPEAAKHLSQIDTEFDEEDQEEHSAPPVQPVPTGNEARPKSLQSVIDQAGEPDSMADVPLDNDII